MDLQAQNQRTDLLKQVKQGDAAAAMAMQELVLKRSLTPDQLPRVFYTATLTAGALKEKMGPFELFIIQKSRKGEESQVRDVVWNSYHRLEERRRETHKLASHTMFEMLRLSPHFVDEIHEDLLDALKNPDEVSAEYLRMISLCEMVLIGKELTEAPKLTELAEAITEGLAKVHIQKEISEMLGNGTDEKKKIKEILKLGKAVTGRMPDEVESVYRNLFSLALNPDCPPNSPCRATLLASLKRARNGVLQVDEVVERRLYRTFGKEPKKQTFWNRMGIKAKGMLSTLSRWTSTKRSQTVYVDPSLLSDGDMSLSKKYISKAKRALAYPVKAVRKTDRRLTHAQ